MVVQLGLDILWTNLFPLLDLKDLYNLYLTHTDLKRAIAEYKNWDQEFQILFNCDYTQDSSTGITKIFKRLNAVPYSWGVFTASTRGKVSAKSESRGFLKITHSPNPIKCSIGPIRQYLGDRAVLLCDGSVAQWSKMYQQGQEGILYESESEEEDCSDEFEYGLEQEYGSIVSSAPGAWIKEPGWPPYVHRLYTNNYEVHAMDGSHLFHQQPTAPAVGIGFGEKVLWASFAYSQVAVLLQNRGLVTGMEFFHPDAYHVLIDRESFPEPMQSFCAISGIGHALLSFTGKVYMAGNGATEVSEVEFPCEIKSIATYDLRYDLEEVRDTNNMTIGWSCWSGKSTLNSVGFLALSVDGLVYYYDLEIGVMGGGIPNLENIVKIVSRGTAMLALDQDGQVFFMGHTDAINPGLGVHVQTDFIRYDRELIPEDILGNPMFDPEVIPVWQYPPCLALSECADMRDQRPYIILPRKVPLPGRAVDINVYGTQASALLIAV